MSTPLRVLIVEDSEDDALLVVRELRRGGYAPTFARVDTPQAMRAALDRQTWDAVIADYSMPHFSAPAALALLQEHGLDIPFLIVSGTIGEETAVAAMRAGAHDYLMKDRLARLVPAIRRELQEAANRREHRRAEEERAQLLAREQAARADAETALEEARAALAIREQFLSVASHELRTPLTALKGQIQLARRRLKRDTPREDLDQLLARADIQVDRLAGLVHELLDVSRIAAGRFVIACEPVALGPLVERVVELERAAEPRRLIELSLPATVPEIEGDTGRLEQVLTNLLDNARKYSPPDTPIHVSVGVAQDTVALAVRDYGIGVPPEDEQRIFDRFHRAGNVDRNIAGFGLGLHIAQEIVRAHGGTLTMESTPGPGTTFTVILPRTCDTAADHDTRAFGLLVTRAEQAQPRR